MPGQWSALRIGLGVTTKAWPPKKEKIESVGTKIRLNSCHLGPLLSNGAISMVSVFDGNLDYVGW